jgi:hypothetical protein
MKLIQFITHPVTIIISFLLILISGESSGGFYFVYLLTGLLHGFMHSILAVIAILILLFALIKYQRTYTNMAEAVLNLAGVCLILLSLFLFFLRDGGHYNYPTFYQVAPFCMLVIFGIIVICSLVFNLGKLKLNRTP